MRLLKENIRARIRRRKHDLICHQVARILHDGSLPDTASAEADFDVLQSQFSPLPEYGYDALSTWWRGVSRAKRLIELTNLEKPLRMLETGCGDGMTGFALSTFGHEVTLSDMEDWRDQRAKHMPIIMGRLEDTELFDKHSFDLAFCYNTFEHVNDPKQALNQMICAVRPGGHIYIEFNPLFCSPWGLHAYRSLRMPYPQFLFSDEFVATKLEALGIYDLGVKRSSLQPLNRWRIGDFESLWAQSECDVVDCELGIDNDHLPVVLSYKASFRGRGLDTRDLVTSGISVLLRRRRN